MTCSIESLSEDDAALRQTAIDTMEDIFTRDEIKSVVLGSRAFDKFCREYSDCTVCPLYYMTRHCKAEFISAAEELMG